MPPRSSGVARKIDGVAFYPWPPLLLLYFFQAADVPYALCFPVPHAHSPLVVSTSPWKTLEGAIAQLMNNVSFYAFRLGPKLVFAGPYPSYPEEPQPSPLDTSRRSSAPSLGDKGLSAESPVDRAKAAAKLLLPRMGWNSRVDHSQHGKSDNSQHGKSDNSQHSSSGSSSRRTEVGRWHGDGWEGAGGPSMGSTPTASVTTASVSDSSGGGHGGGSDGIRRNGDVESEGSRIKRAVSEALDRSVLSCLLLVNLISTFSA